MTTALDRCPAFPALRIGNAPLPAAQRRARGHAVLGIVMASYLILVLDVSVVITALPTIHAQLKFSAAGLAWVQNAYVLPFGGLLLLGARAGDILGRRLTFVVGMAVFTSASLVVAMAVTPAWMIAGRTLQGIGAAVSAPATLALLSAAYPTGGARSRAFSRYAAVGGVGASLGLVLGGLLTSYLSWRVGFLINVPIGALIMVTALRYLQESDRARGRFDLGGAASSTLGMAALVWGIMRCGDSGFTNSLTLTTLVVGVVLLVGFVVAERRASQPIMPLHLFADAERAAAYAARLCFLAGMVGFWFFLSLYLQDVRGMSPVETGLAFLPATVCNFATALAVPRVNAWFGHGRLLVVALVSAVAGMAWLSRIDSGTSYLVGVALPMMLIGIGQGGALGPLTDRGVAGVATVDAGAAAGMVNAAHQLGASLGLAIIVTIFAATPDAGGSPQQVLAHRISNSLTGGALLLALAAVVTVASGLVAHRSRRAAPACVLR
jgi:EmrB/QacA subfamily drug resistance transporter